jgi:hypothetical protein
VLPPEASTVDLRPEVAQVVAAVGVFTFFTFAPNSAKDVPTMDPDIIVPASTTVTPSSDRRPFASTATAASVSPSFTVSPSSARVGLDARRPSSFISLVHL